MKPHYMYRPRWYEMIVAAVLTPVLISYALIALAYEKILCLTGNHDLYMEDGNTWSCLRCRKEIKK